MGFGVWGLGFGVWGLGFGVWGLGFGVWGLGFGVQVGSQGVCGVALALSLGRPAVSLGSGLRGLRQPITREN